MSEVEKLLSSVVTHLCVRGAESSGGKDGLWQFDTLACWGVNLLFFFLCCLAACPAQTRGLSRCLLSHICKAFHSHPEVPEHWPTLSIILGQRLLCNVPGSWAAVKHAWSQNDRMVGVGRDLCGSSGPNPLPKQGHLQQAAQDRIQAGLEYLQRRRLHNLPGQPVPGLRHPQREEVLPMFSWNFLCFSLCPLPLVLSLGTTENGMQDF